MLKNLRLLVETVPWGLLFVTVPEPDVISDSSRYDTLLELGLVGLVCNWKNLFSCLLL